MGCSPELVLWFSIQERLPIVSIVVPFFGLTKSILRILKGNPEKRTTMEAIGRVSSEVPWLGLPIYVDSGV